MFCMVEVTVKGEDGGCALNCHGNYIVDHGISWNCVFEFLWELLTDNLVLLGT